MNIDSKTPDYWGCKNSTFLYPHAEHVMGNLNFTPEARICNTISKRPEYRFPYIIDFPKCCRDIDAS